MTVGHAWTERKKMFLKSPTGIRDLCEVSEDQLTVGEETTLLQFGDGLSSFATGIFALVLYSTLSSILQLKSGESLSKLPAGKQRPAGETLQIFTSEYPDTAAAAACGSR